MRIMQTAVSRLISAKAAMIHPAARMLPGAIPF